MKKVVVTGATGFLGSHLIAELIKAGFDVDAVCRKMPENSNGTQINFRIGDIEDPYSLKETFFNAEVVIHAAALVSADPLDDQRMFKTNVEGTKNVVDSCLSAGVRRLIYVSSVAALGGEDSINLIDEQTGWKGPKKGYGYTKYKGGLEVCRGEAEGLEIAIIYPSVILGPGNADRSSGKIFKLIKSGFPFAPAGMVNAVDARDVAAIVTRLATGEKSGLSLILNGFSISWKDLFSRVAKAQGRSGKFITVSGKVASVFVWCYEKFCRVIGRRPFITVNAVKMACKKNRYDTRKATQELGFAFRSADQTLDWVSNTENQELSQI